MRGDMIWRDGITLKMAIGIGGGACCFTFTLASCFCGWIDGTSIMIEDRTH